MSPTAGFKGPAFLLLVLACACGPAVDADRRSEAGAGVGPASGPIVLVTLSGLRPDVVGALGGESGWTPHIDAFAGEADWVGTAVVASSAPAVSLVSLMTGVSPWQHQVLTHAPAGPRAGIPTLAQALAGAGYRTEARVPLDYDLDHFGLLEGFEKVAEIEPIDATARALASSTGGAELYWIHLREANVAYQRRDAQLPRLAGRSAGLPAKIDGWRLWPYADPRLTLPPEERAVAWELFRHEVAWADRQVGEMLSALRESRHWDRAWVVLTASQGTEFGEHGQVLYAQNLGRESIEVPLIVKLPRTSAGSLAVSEERPAGQLRLWATLIEAAGGRAAPVHAPSLFRPAAPPIVSELYRRNGVNLLSLLSRDVQLIWTSRFAPEEPEFYFAQLALSGGRPPLTESAHAILGRLRKAFRRTPPFTGPVGGATPVLDLERWTEEGTREVDDPELALELAAELYRRWRRFVDRERAPERESALSRPAG